MNRIKNSFVRNHFQADYVEDIGGGWSEIRDAVLRARRILADPVTFPKANTAYLEKLDLEGTSELLNAPVQYLA